MLAQEPDLQFVAAEHLTDHQIVSTVIAQFRSAAGQSARLPDDDLVCVEQARQLHGNFFPAAWWTLDLRGFSDIRRHGDANATKKLDSLGNGIHQFDLLAEMFVEEQVQLIKSGAGDLPMRFLVEIA